MTTQLRPRRSCLAVPGSSQKFIDKARTLVDGSAHSASLNLSSLASAPRAEEHIRAAHGAGGNDVPKVLGIQLDLSLAHTDDFLTATDVL